MGTPTRSHGGERFTRVECRAMGTDVVVLLDGVRGATARAAVARYVVDRLAEVVAKAAFVLGPRGGADLVARPGPTGVMVHDDGRIDDLPGVAAFRA